MDLVVMGDFNRIGINSVKRALPSLNHIISTNKSIDAIFSTGEINNTSDYRPTYQL